MPDRKEIKLQVGTNVIQTGEAYDWDLISIQGDDYMDVDVSVENLGAQDGAYLKSIRYQPRYIDVVIRSGLSSSAQIDATELQLKSYLDSKLAAELTIYKNGVTRIGFGYIASVKKPMNLKWNKQPFLTITVILPNPWLFGEETENTFNAETGLICFPLSFIADVGLTAGVAVSGNEITFTVGGHDPCGFVLTLTATGACVNPKITDANGDYVRVLETMADEDVVVISTIARDKFTELNGVVCKYDRLSDFFTLAVGSNTLTVSADSGVDNLVKSLTWRERYRG